MICLEMEYAIQANLEEFNSLTHENEEAIMNLKVMLNDYTDLGSFRMNIHDYVWYLIYQERAVHPEDIGMYLPALDSECPASTQDIYAYALSLEYEWIF